MKSLISPLKLASLLIAVQITSSCGSGGGGGGSGATPSPTPEANASTLPNSTPTVSDVQKTYDAAKASLQAVSGLEFRDSTSASGITTVILGRQTPGVAQAAYDANPLISRTEVRASLKNAFDANVALKNSYSETAPERLKTENSLLSRMLDADGVKSGANVLSAADTAAAIASIKSSEEKLDSMGLKLIPTYSSDFSTLSSTQSNRMTIDFKKSKVEDATIKSSSDKVRASFDVLLAIPKAFEDELYFQDVYQGKKSLYSALKLQLL